MTSCHETVDSNEKKLQAVDLFCGCGGMSLGLRQAGFQVMAGIDIEPLAIEAYRANHPDTKAIQADICEVDPHLLMADLGMMKGDLPLLVGCPPCQGFSTMRTLNGARTVEDYGNDLLFEFLRFAEVMQPQAIMLENVPGLAEDARFKLFYEKLGKLGYMGKYDVLNTVDYRVPQRRRRLIYLGALGKEIPFAARNEEEITVRQAIGHLPPAGASGDAIHDIPERRTQRIRELIRLIPRDGGSRTDLPEEYVLECHKKCSGFKDVYGRMAWDSPSPTITSGCFNPSKGRFLHPVEDRAITLREAALLQGFPEDYCFPNTNSKSDIALMIGNALPPPFIAAHARSIRNIL
ncbi:DNA (cytosine-5)-methyltransferase 1 [Paucidesulfovibrio gracilis DSM 16080]|uniref:DNA (cytosine-5-)-methyltransferase n=1 Tax=Paucidesulfovibrio gracilis DSM 16080 TaxID=1121449 RepID=A0A1T4W4B7_9BACT|nr:DNA cytosine methyltransferase [Paucidesulfovibrio gracilis]SKA72110.1 DNA (cytosine-5)-methyltransferase 1 [Paucidesulfovibrio gracilis DSM 16080]